jgi:hypothetical protein
MTPDRPSPAISPPGERLQSGVARCQIITFPTRSTVSGAAALWRRRIWRVLMKKLLLVTLSALSLLSLTGCYGGWWGHHHDDHGPEFHEHP